MKNECFARKSDYPDLTKADKQEYEKEIKPLSYWLRNFGVFLVKFIFRTEIKLFTIQ